MRRTAFLVTSLWLLSAAALLLSMNGCAGGASSTTTPPPPPPTGPAGIIKHVVIIFQENRTPDNLFHDPVLIAAGADIASTGLTPSGSIPLTAGPLGVNYDMGHTHASFLAMYDGGKMDGASNIQISCYAPPCPANPNYTYVQASDVGPYFALAEQYTFGDHMFQTNEGPSYPAHQFILSGTSAPTATSDLFVAENTVTGTGCAAPAGSTVSLIDPQGNESGTMYPCFEHLTLSDELTSQSVTWRYYAPTAESIWTAPNSIQHICDPQTQNGQLVCAGSEWSNVIIPSKQVLTDIANGQLAGVTWVIPAGQNSDHPNSSTWTGGPSWVASIVNAIGNSSYWSNTAIFIAWDDWGGWYDHIPPPQVITDGTSWGSGYVYGFRVPLIVVSPYAKAKYISHVNHDFGSILNFIEETYGLPSLGYADAHTADNLSDCFNFGQTPLTFQTIPAPMDAQHFINDQSRPEPPDND